MLGRILIAASGLAQALAFTFDFSDTHVLNPRWPPHARFHVGQTMSMGACLGLITLYYTYRPVSSTAAARDSLFTAAVCSSFYWVAGLSAILYPGSKGVDPEFGEGFPQLWIFSSILACSWIGWWLEKEGKAEGEKK